MKITFLFTLLTLIAQLAIADPVHNVTSGVDYTDIQTAINAASAGDVITVDAGTYTTAVNINKSLTLKGPNAGIDPNTGTRVAEAVLQNIAFTITGGTTVIVDGFKIAITGELHGIDLNSGGSVAATIQYNIFDRQATTGGQNRHGIYLAAGTAVKTIKNNLFTGSTPYGSVSSHKTWRAGIWGNGGNMVIKDNVFYQCNTDINFETNISGVTLEGNTFSNSGTGIAFGAMPAGYFTFGANEFATSLTTIINNSPAILGFRLDITAGTYGGTPFASLPLADLFNIDAKMYHRGRDGTKLGLVYYVANNIYVHSTTNAVVQPAINYAASGDIINVADKSGNGYREFLTIDKPLTIRGQSQSGTNVSAPASGTGSGFKINSGVTDVSIENLTIKNYTGTGTTLDAGIYAAGGNDNLSVKGVTIQGNTNASGIYINGGTGISIQQSTITGNVNGIGASGGSLSITENYINNNTANGILLTNAASAAIHDNSITGNTTSGLDNQTAASTNATCNWWGTAVAANLPPFILGNVTYAPFLINNTDTQSGTPGFQPSSTACSGSLPVVFGNITAKISNNMLLVQWTALSEQGSSHFDIEGASDGVHFVKIGTVVSKAVNGNSGESTLYSFTTDASKAAGLLGISFLATAMLLLLFNRKNRWAYLFILVAGIGWSIQSCTKGEKVIDRSGTELYIRIAQTDTDGAVKYSKIVKVEKE